MKAEEIEKRFNHHPPTTEERVSAHQEVREEAKRFASVLARLPPGREAALATTKLEEAMFWANAAIARNE